MAGLDEDTATVGHGFCFAHSFHFLFACARAALFPFLTLYFRQLGLTATQVGLVFGVKAIMWMWCAPLWTSCAKWCNKKKFVMAFSLLTLMSSTLLITFVPPADPDLPKAFCDADANTTSIFSLFHTGSGAVPGPVSDDNDTLLSVTLSSGVTVAVTEASNEDVNAAIVVETTTVVPTTAEKHHHHRGPKTTEEPGTTTTTTTPAPTTTTVSERQVGPVNNEGQEEQNDLGDDLGEDVSAEDEESFNYDQFLEDLEQYGLTVEDFKNLDSDQLTEYIKQFSGEQKVRRKRSFTINNMTLKERFDNLRMRLGLPASHETFIFIIVIILLGELFAAPAEKMSDDCWFEYLDIVDSLERYGSHKAWASLGTMLTAPLVAIIVDHTACIIFDMFSHFLIHFFVFAGLMLFTFTNAIAFPVSQNKKTPKRSRLGKGIRILCGDPHAFIFSLTMFIVGLVYAALNNFLYWYVQDLGGSESLIGLSIGVMAFSELVMYPLRNWIIKHVTHAGAVALSLVVLSGRLVFYSFMWNPWLVLIGELLHGCSYTLLWGAIYLYPDFRLNPFIMDRSAYAVINAIHFGLGMAGGSMLSGFLFDFVSFSLMCQGSAIFIASWCFLFMIVRRFVFKKQKIRYSKLLQDDQGGSSDDDETLYEDDWLEVAMNGKKR